MTRPTLTAAQLLVIEQWMRDAFSDGPLSGIGESRTEFGLCVVLAMRGVIRGETVAEFLTRMAEAYDMGVREACRAAYEEGRREGLARAERAEEKG